MKREIFWDLLDAFREKPVITCLLTFIKNNNKGIRSGSDPFSFYLPIFYYLTSMRTCYAMSRFQQNPNPS